MPKPASTPTSWTTLTFPTLTTDVKFTAPTITLGYFVCNNDSFKEDCKKSTECLEDWYYWYIKPLENICLGAYFKMTRVKDTSSTPKTITGKFGACI